MSKVQIWERGKMIREVEVKDLTNELLVDEYGAQSESESRRISTDRPSIIDELYNEILSRMNR